MTDATHKAMRPLASPVPTARKTGDELTPYIRTARGWKAGRYDILFCGPGVDQAATSASASPIPDPISPLTRSPRVVMAGRRRSVGVPPVTEESR